MIQLDIPGKGNIILKYAVFDVNGTLAVDGELVRGLQKPLHHLQDTLDVYLLTADTHGKQDQINRQLNLQATIIQPGQEAQQKAAFVEDLGSQHVIAFGQGANDAKMIAAAAIGVCLISHEGTARETLLNADLVVPDILSGLALLSNPTRLSATLRR